MAEMRLNNWEEEKEHPPHRRRAVGGAAGAAEVRLELADLDRVYHLEQCRLAVSDI
jgi:hypothetical protein